MRLLIVLLTSLCFVCTPAAVDELKLASKYVATAKIGVNALADSLRGAGPGCATRLEGVSRLQDLVRDAELALAAGKAAEATAKAREASVGGSVLLDGCWGK